MTINNYVKYNGCNYKVRLIYEKAFSNSIQPKKIIIDNDILGFCDFSGNLIQITNTVFKNQTELESVDFGNINSILGDKCFENCRNIVDVKMSKNMTKIIGYCFTRCSSIKNIDLSEIKDIEGQSNFANCSKLESIVQINNEITELPDKTFMSCDKLKISSLNNVTKLGNEVFEYCRALNKDIVNNVDEIGDKCFWGCNFGEVYLKKATKIGERAFGGSSNLKKIRFGSAYIPFFYDNIAERSSVNEWVYPLIYKSQSGYSKFLSKLLLSKVIWYDDYEKKKCQETQSVSLNSFNPPSFSRDGYEIEGWYKEPECVNKVNIIADLGEIIDADIVIKDPVLYAKWISKESTKPEEPKETGTTKEPSKPEQPKETGTPKEPTKPEEPKETRIPKEPIKPEEPKETGTPKEPTKPEEPKETGTPKEPIKPEDTKDIITPQNPNDSKNNYNKNKKNTRSRHKTRKTKNSVNNLILKNQEVHTQDNNKLFLENEVIKNMFLQSIKISKITEKNQWIDIFMKNIDYFKNNTTMGVNIKNIGNMKIGWNIIDNEWYYMKGNGELAINTIIDGYAIGYDGKLN